jgi:hypothetical protein
MKYIDFKHQRENKQNSDKWIYYIDRCELWGFIREINSDILHVKYQFFPAGTTFT